MNILDDNNISEATFNSEHTPSPELQKKIQKLIEDEKAQLSRPWSYWEKMRKSDLNLYRSPKQSAQRMKDAIALGEAFKDGDYND